MKDFKRIDSMDSTNSTDSKARIELILDSIDHALQDNLNDPDLPDLYMSLGCAITEYESKVSKGYGKQELAVRSFARAIILDKDVEFPLVAKLDESYPDMKKNFKEAKRRVASLTRSNRDLSERNVNLYFDLSGAKFIINGENVKINNNNFTNAKNNTFNFR